MQQMQPQSRTVDVDVERYGSEIQVVFSQVYLLMTLGLEVTALVAAWVSTWRVSPSAWMMTGIRVLK